jgi:hypothetical protein
MIGKYVNDFKQRYKDTIERAYTLNDVRNLVDEYDGIQSVKSGFLVLDGVGFLSDVGQNSLLKFIEESKLPIILLSQTDKVSPIIMSRMKIVVKKWYPIEKVSFVQPRDALKALAEKKKDVNFKELQEAQFLADNCPSLYAIKQSAGDPFDYANNRMISIFCGRPVKKVGP